MARRSIPIEERIAAQEQEVLKTKKKFEEASDKLKDLYRKRDEGRKNSCLRPWPEAADRSKRSWRLFNRIPMKTNENRGLSSYFSGSTH